MAFYQRSNPEPVLNVTAFIDVLLLLVIFLVLSFSVSRGAVEHIQIKLPESHEVSQTEGSRVSKNWSIFIDAEGRYRLGEQRLEVQTYQDLKKQLDSSLVSEDKISVFGDERAPYRSVVFLLEAIDSLGIQTVEIKMLGAKHDSRS